MLDGGTRTSSKNSSAVSCAFWPIFFEVAAALEAGTVGLHQHQDHALGAGAGIGLGDDDDEIGEPAVGDEGLLAVDDELVALAQRRGAHACRSLPVPGSVMAMARDHLALGHRGSQARFCSSLP